ncbi:flavin reductase [Micromonospora sp. STR1_7]|uniref:Flavin reductase n=1 Tax=Micromonospora parastrephiae TaxID=2806101 RepID=A0ABS1XS77_9ACTN|nr:flavin reductase [Micromonospora parastrephiae]MBM0232110.1 flavin reductase [Micromonospora parastrephiae]
MTGRTEHPVLKPAWRCRTCGIAWPCSAAKLRLLGEYRGRRDELVEHLKALQAEATVQLTELNGGAPPGCLTERFTGWAQAR